MANFTHEVKRELLGKKLNGRAEKRASLSAFMRTNGTLSFTEGKLGFLLSTESERIGERYMTFAEELYGAECTAIVGENRLSGNKMFTFAYNGEKTYDLLIDLGVFERESEEDYYDLFDGIPERVVSDEKSRLAYIVGAFLGSGSCTLPKRGARTGYHLEFVFSGERMANDFSSLLASCEILAKTVKRKESFVVYLTSVAAMSDFFAVIGAKNALETLNEMAEEREGRNNDNRVNNCFVGNMDRTLTAAAKQCYMIEYLTERGVIALQDEALRVTAKMRLDYPEASLKELAELLSIGKSCLNHRLRRIAEFYEEEKKAEEGEKKE